MASVQTTATITVQVTDAEWRLIMKALAALAGVTFKAKPGEREKAEVLNRTLLRQRRADLQERLAVAEVAYRRAEEHYTNVRFEQRVEPYLGEEVLDDEVPKEDWAGLHPYGKEPA